MGIRLKSAVDADSRIVGAVAPEAERRTSHNVGNMCLEPLKAKNCFHDGSPPFFKNSPRVPWWARWIATRGFLQAYGTNPALGVCSVSSDLLSLRQSNREHCCRPPGRLAIVPAPNCWVGASQNLAGDAEKRISARYARDRHTRARALGNVRLELSKAKNSFHMVHLLSSGQADSARGLPEPRPSQLLLHWTSSGSLLLKARRVRMATIPRFLAVAGSMACTARCSCSTSPLRLVMRRFPVKPIMTSDFFLTTRNAMSCCVILVVIVRSRAEVVPRRIGGRNALCSLRCLQKIREGKLIASRRSVL